jgi:hypothetical protein
MELSKRSVALLKIFANINPNLRFEAGNVQRTISTTESVLVEAEFDETFPRKFSICDLSIFLRNLEVLENPVIELNDRTVRLYSKTGIGDVTLNYGSEDLIKSPPEGKSLDDSAATRHVKITKNQLATIMKFAEVNTLTHIYIGHDGKETYMVAREKSNQDSAKARIVLGTEDNGEVWEDAFAFDRFTKLSLEDYDVKLLPQTFASFTAPRIKFFIAAEK